MRTGGCVFLAFGLLNSGHAVYLGESATFEGTIRDWDGPQAFVSVVTQDAKSTVVSTAPIEANGHFSLKLPVRVPGLPVPLKNQWTSGQGCRAAGEIQPKTALWYRYALQIRSPGGPLGTVRLGDSAELWKKSGISAELIYFDRPVFFDGTRSCPTLSERFSNIRVSKGWNLLPFRWIYNDQGLEERVYNLGSSIKSLSWSAKEPWGVIGVTLGIHPKATGIYIQKVFESSPAQLAGLRVGDRLMRLDKQDVSKNQLDNVVRLLRGEPGKDIDVTVERDGVSMRFKVSRVLAVFR